jgi:hypothetical protein
MCYVRDITYCLHSIYIYYARISLGMHTIAKMEEKV